MCFKFRSGFPGVQKDTRDLPALTRSLRLHPVRESVIKIEKLTIKSNMFLSIVFGILFIALAIFVLNRIGKGRGRK